MTRRSFLWAAYLICLHAGLVAVLLERHQGRPWAMKPGGLRSSHAEHYERMVTYYRRQDPLVPDGAVVFLGDSFIQGMCVSAVHDKAVNFGIGGDTTVGLLCRLPAYRCLKRARAVVVAIGYNDLRERGNEQILSGYQEILSEMPEGVPVLLCSVLPIDERCRREKYNHRIVALNRRAAGLCTPGNDRHFVDAGEPLRGPDGNLVCECHEPDGIHLNARGYDIWIGVLRTQLRQAL